MSFIHFSKEQLSTLESGLEKEFLLANTTGAYTSSSLVNCNTRKYHGLLIVPQAQLDENRYVLLSSLDETILQDNKATKLGTHRYPGTTYPEGYAFIESFSMERCPEWIIRAAGNVLKKEILLLSNEERVLIRYTLIDSTSPLKIRFDPFLAFRNIHSVGKSNNHVNKKTEKTENGILLKMYPGFSDLFLQFSKTTDFIAVPDWHYNNEYDQERNRGYEFMEDLYCPGYFTATMKKGDQLVFSAGLTSISPRRLKSVFESQLKKNLPVRNFDECLEHAAGQFFVRSKDGSEIIAGFPWFGKWGRDTFIALPGLTLTTGNIKLFKPVVDTLLRDLREGLFPNTGSGNRASYNSADASLWFFWALQQYALATGSANKTWDTYGSKMKSILENYRKGTLHAIHMEDNGLLYAGEPGFAVTWMDAVVDGKPVTPRIGKTVELNALWYNAVRFALETAAHAEDESFISSWDSIPQQIESAFRETFWNKEKGYLADFVNGPYKDWSLRPNQVIAVSLPYSVVNDEIKKSVMTVVNDKLLTPRGLRTLAPGESHYKGTYSGNHRERDLAYHQGTVWPWLLGHFSEAYLKTFGDKELPFIRSLYESFSPAVFEYGIGSVAEIYDGDEPYKAKGAISQAWSVAELLRMKAMLSGGIPMQPKKSKKNATLQTLSN